MNDYPLNIPDDEKKETINENKGDSIILSFTEMSEPKKQKMLLQLLKVSNRHTCSFISSVLLPALRVDFLTCLPFELVENILHYLDHTALSNCSRVSKNWYKIICETHVLIWKDLIIYEGWANLLARDIKVDGIINYKNLYKKYYLTRMNWFTGNSKKYSVPTHGTNVATDVIMTKDYLITSSDDQTINCFHKKTGILKHQLMGHEGGVWCVCNIDDHLIVSGSTDRTLRVWVLETGKCCAIFKGHASTIRCLNSIHVSTTKDSKTYLILSGSRDSTIKAWKLVVSISNSNQLVIHIKETPQCITTFLGHTNSVRALVASANDQIVVSGSYDHHVRIWNLLTGECKFNLSGHSNRIYTVEYIETSKRVFSGSMDNLIMIWDALTGSRIHILEGHNSLVGLLSVKTLPFMPFSTIVTPKSTRGSSDDCVNDKSIHIHRYEQHPVLISASADCTLRLWNPMKGTPISILYGHNSAVTCFHFDQDKVVSGSEHGIKLWDLRKPGNYFVRDIITGIQCAWNILMDDSKLVTAIQKDGLTWLEVYDFNSETVFEDLPEIEKYQEVLVSIGDKIIDKNPIEIMLDEIIQ